MTTPRAAVRHIPGEGGLWVLIFGDMTVFAAIFGAFLVERADAPVAFARDAAELAPPLGAANALVLLTSSLLVALAVRRHRVGLGETAAAPLAGAAACAAVFVAFKALEWGGHLSAGHAPADSGFWMLYFVITGLHLVHLLIGSGLLLVMCRAMRRGASPAEHRLLVECCATYWHMVDLLWIVIFPLLYLSAT